MKVFSYKRHLFFAAAAPVPLISAAAGALALSETETMPPLWFFVMLWTLFSLLVFGMSVKKTVPAPLESSENKQDDIKSPEPEKVQQGKKQPNAPGPFVPKPFSPDKTKTPLPEQRAAPTPIPVFEEKQETPWEEETLVDDSIIRRHIILGEDFVRKLFDIFVEDSPARLEEMKKSSKEKIPEKTRTAAHALKGSAAAIGAKRLAGICNKIQRNCDEGKIEEIRELVEKAPNIFEKTREAVKSYDFSRLER